MAKELRINECLHLAVILYTLIPFHYEKMVSVYFDFNSYFAFL